MSHHVQHVHLQEHNACMEAAKGQPGIKNKPLDLHKVPESERATLEKIFGTGFHEQEQVEIKMEDVGMKMEYAHVGLTVPNQPVALIKEEDTGIGSISVLNVPESNLKELKLEGVSQVDSDKDVCRDLEHLSTGDLVALPQGELEELSKGDLGLSETALNSLARSKDGRPQAVGMPSACTHMDM